ncbi:MAG: hypothetical protein EOO92_10135 [Pedobacter sp.]|nr:MAG: hypothetical protein EOO92_10135 [Pedobacter sp.]
MKYIALLLVFICKLALAQSDSIAVINLSDTTKKSKFVPPLIFGDVMFGKSFGFMAGTSLNYQIKKSLITLRFVSVYEIRSKPAHVLLPIPVIYSRESREEAAILFGRRIIRSGTSMSFSMGLSTSQLQLYDRQSGTTTSPPYYLGFPFEASMIVFNKIKQRYRVFYGLIPILKPTALSRSIGLKITGNISKHSYVGLGLNVGLGYHKVYDE